MFSKQFSLFSVVFAAAALCASAKNVVSVVKMYDNSECANETAFVVQYPNGEINKSPTDCKASGCSSYGWGLYTVVECHDSLVPWPRAGGAMQVGYYKEGCAGDPYVLTWVNPAHCFVRPNPPSNSRCVDGNPVVINWADEGACSGESTVAEKLSTTCTDSVKWSCA